MRDNQEISGVKSQELESLFKKTCDKVVNILGERPFHIWSGLNVAAFDSIFTTFALNDLKDNLAEQYEHLKNDGDFIKGVRGATADEAIVELRMQLAKQYLVA
jgi:hypothetical protein